MRSLFDRALAHYAQADVHLQMRARFLLGVCLILVVIIPIVISYSMYVQLHAPGQHLNPHVCLSETLLLMAVLSILVLLIRGHFSLSAHLTIITIMSTVWSVILSESIDPIARLDTVVLGVAVLSMTPLALTRRRFAVILYGALSLLCLYGFMYFFRSDLSIPDYLVVDYLSDNTVAIVFVSIIAYSLFTINDRALALARSEIAERTRAEQTVLSQKEQLEETNNELSMAVEKMALTTREYEEANVELEAANTHLTEAQAAILSTNALLKDSEEKFSKAFRLSPLMIGLVTYPEGRYVDVSDYFCRVVEYSREHILGRNAEELNLWADPAEAQQFNARIASQTAILDREILMRSRSGTVHTILLSAERITLWQEPHVIHVGVDITERKLAEEEKGLLEAQLRQSQKMESIGRLAGGVAHDFNNLLTAILGNTGLALMELPAESRIHARLKVVMKASESAADLTRQLLAFSRKQAIEPKTLDLAHLLEGMRGLLARLIGEDIHLEISADPRLGMISADPGQIEQIVVNLVVNARDAMPDGGRLTIAMTDVILDDAYVERHPYTVPGAYVRLTVSDTGCGISPATQRHLFEPFFTTKPVGKGTGLGLATVYGAVKQNGGSIEVDSEPGRGTTFTMYFPRLRDESVGLAEQTPGEDLPTGTETILLAEDSPLVLDFAQGILTQMGYTVLPAGSGEEALEIAERHPQPIDLLLTDVIMPGMNGRVLADQLVSARPGLRVLFTSGYVADIIQQHGVLEDGLHFIGKPYTARSLAHKIREVLDLGKR